MPRSGSSSAVPNPSAGERAPMAVGPFLLLALLPGRKEEAEEEGSGERDGGEGEDGVEGGTEREDEDFGRHRLRRRCNKAVNSSLAACNNMMWPT